MSIQNGGIVNEGNIDDVLQKLYIGDEKHGKGVLFVGKDKELHFTYKKDLSFSDRFFGRYKLDKITEHLANINNTALTEKLSPFLNRKITSHNNKYFSSKYEHIQVKDQQVKLEKLSNEDIAKSLKKSAQEFANLGPDKKLADKEEGKLYKLLGKIQMLKDKSFGTAINEILSKDAIQKPEVKKATELAVENAQESIRVVQFYLSQYKPENAKGELKNAKATAEAIKNNADRANILLEIAALQVKCIDVKKELQTGTTSTEESWTETASTEESSTELSSTEEVIQAEEVDTESMDTKEIKDTLTKATAAAKTIEDKTVQTATLDAIAQIQSKI